MPKRLACSALFVVMMAAGAARAATAQTCVAIDEPRDMLSRDERAAAVLLVGKQFDLAGLPFMNRDCAETYTLSHIRLGTTIVVTLSAAKGSRQATARGLDDLPAVFYSQMVRALMTGQPMGRLAILNRTNVSAAPDLALSGASAPRAPGPPGSGTAASSVTRSRMAHRSGSGIGPSSTGSASMCPS